MYSKSLMLLLGLNGLFITNSVSASSVVLAYKNVLPDTQLIIKQTIKVGDEGKMQVLRNFNFEFSNSDKQISKQPEPVVLTLEHVKASYTAHEQTMTLPSRHIRNNAFRYQLSDDKKHWIKSEQEEKYINLGTITEPGYSVANSLTSVLPILPKIAIAEGSTWSTKREFQSLEGWSWADGTTQTTHTVKRIETVNKEVIVHIESQAVGKLKAFEGKDNYQSLGPLTRELSWTFNATNGQLTSLNLHQKAKGKSKVPQGMVKVENIVNVKLTTSQ